LVCGPIWGLLAVRLWRALDIQCRLPLDPRGHKPALVGRIDRATIGRLGDDEVTPMASIASKPRLPIATGLVLRVRELDESTRHQPSI